MDFNLIELIIAAAAAIATVLDSCCYTRLNGAQQPVEAKIDNRVDR